MNLFIDFPGTKSSTTRLSEATVAVWLVVNYRFVCSGLHKPLLKVLEVRFCEHAGSCNDIYEKELILKSINKKC